MLEDDGGLIDDFNGDRDDAGFSCLGVADTGDTRMLLYVALNIGCSMIPAKICVIGETDKGMYIILADAYGTFLVRFKMIIT